MSSEEGIKEYKSRSKTVEAHNGTFKRIYHYDSIPITGLKRVQNLINVGDLRKIFNLWIHFH
jgi:hypothetical protein